MIVKILSSASKDFHGVKYNDKKINSDKGELMDMKNFPSFINKDSSQEEVRNYLKSISQSNKTKKPQFHAVISTKFQEHSKEQLTKIANEFMKEMGYGSQPYIVVFHKDTENNHVHIVSTRVDKDTGKKINDSFEKIKSQQALSKAMETVLGVSREADIDKLLQYKYSTFQQLEKLLEQNGFKVHINESNPNQANILHNGLCHKTLFLDKLHYEKVDKNDKRAKQIKAFLEKYKDMYQIFNEKEQQLVSDVIKYIYENYTKELTINDVTEKFNITDTKLNKILMSYSGKRFIEFLNALKIDKACEMLLTTDKSVIDISFELGFNTVKTFNNNFTKLKNMSPTDFRKTVKHGS